jgi:hypothetical protein
MSAREDYEIALADYVYDVANNHGLCIADSRRKLNQALNALSGSATDSLSEASVPNAQDVESRFSELIATELDHYAQKIAKRVLRKALGGKIAERSSADNT